MWRLMRCKVNLRQEKQLAGEIAMMPLGLSCSHIACILLLWQDTLAECVYSEGFLPPAAAQRKSSLSVTHSFARCTILAVWSDAKVACFDSRAAAKLTTLCIFKLDINTYFS